MGWLINDRPAQLNAMNAKMRDEFAQAFVLREEERLITAVEATAGISASIWALVQTFDKIVNFRLNRRKLRADPA